MRSAQRRRLIGGLVVSVAVLYGGIAVALVQSTTAAFAVGWGVVIAATGICVGLLIDLHTDLRAESRAIEVILGQGEVLRHYEELRRTEGAVLIQAIWSARYPLSELESYFAAERSDLNRSATLRIERLICSDVMGDAEQSALARLEQGVPNLTLWKTEPLVLECNICEYIHERSSYLRALVVFAGADKTAQVALLLDTRREPGLVGVVYALRAWFEGLPRDSFRRQ